MPVIIYIKSENWCSCSLTPKAVREDEDITVLWNQGLQTEALVNRLDITFENMTQILITDIRNNNMG